MIGDAPGAGVVHVNITPRDFSAVADAAGVPGTAAAATVVGTGLTAAVQGAIVGLGFLVTGLNDPLFWGVVTMVFAILPVVGAGMIWAPAALSLVINGRPLAAIGLALLGLVVVANIENLIRPYVFKRYSEIHPMITLVGAVVGVSYFGILGLLIGPLALSYFFELIRMYREEYLTDG